MKVLILDCETSPHLAYTFELFRTTIPVDRVVVPSRTLCFAAKWHGSRKVQFFSEWGDGHGAMVEAAHGLVEAADLIVGYNQDHFDTPTLQWEYALAELGVPAPHQSVDLYKVVRRRFRPASRKLGYVSSSLGIGSKVEHEGFALWTSVLDGDEKAQKRMERYCRGDVILTELLYDKLLPWIDTHPNRNVIDDTEGCPRCPSTDLTRQGFTFTALGRYQRFRCSNGHWSRATRRDAGDTRRSI